MTAQRGEGPAEMGNGVVERRRVRIPPAGLWRDADFLKLWTGETISLFGSQVTSLALPLTAALTLGASPGQLGFLSAAQFLPFLLLTLLAGLWVDRHRRRPILIAANLARGLLMSAIPALAFLGELRMAYLYGIAFLAGSCTVFFDLAYQSYLPVLIHRAQLVEGNSKLQVSASAAAVGGPGLAGILVEVLTAPVAIALDAASFLVSALSLGAIRRPEPDPGRQAEPSGRLLAIRQGFQAVFGDPRLRAIAGEAASYNLLSQAILTVFVLYATRELGMSPGLYGFVIAAGSVGGLSGSLLAAPAARRRGVGPTILGAMVLACSSPVLIPLAEEARGLQTAVLMLALFLEGVGVAASNVHVVSLRQAITPDHLLGRMNASYRLLIYGTIPIGALLGGSLGEFLGLRETLWVCAIALLLAPLWVWFSPVRALERLPDSETAQG